MKKRSVIFGDYNTADYGWTLTGLTLSDPEQKLNYVEKTGGDGAWDLSTVMTDGIPKYKNRTLTVTLENSQGTRDDREQLINELVNKLDGLEWKIVLPDRPDHYLIGRLHVAVTQSSLAYAAVTVTGSCQPWFYSVREKIVELTDISMAQKSVQIYNAGRRAVSPVLEVFLTEAAQEAQAVSEPAAVSVAAAAAPSSGEPLQTQTFSVGVVGDLEYNRYSLQLIVTEDSISEVDNTSTVSYVLQLVSGSRYFNDYGLGAEVKLNGEQVAYRDRANSPQVSIQANSTLELLSGTEVIPHNADGTLTMAVEFSIDMDSNDYTPGSITVTDGTMTLTPIAQAAPEDPTPSAIVILKYGDLSTTLSDGLYEWPALLLTSGYHTLQYMGFPGSMLRITYREAVLR